jgi:hypothetical protein
VALYYTLKFRGTINALNWAVHTHWRFVSSTDTPTELVKAQTLAQAAYDFWDSDGKIICTNKTNLTKVQVEGYQEPSALAEIPAAILGTLTDSICPPFTAKGFRQFRSDSTFRTSSHRFPDVREANNVDGSWVFDGGVTELMINAVASWLGSELVATIPDSLATITYQPVLIKTQTTSGSDLHPPKVVTFLDPHEISDVASAAFYGVTSQVSRKFVLPT